MARKTGFQNFVPTISTSKMRHVPKDRSMKRNKGMTTREISTRLNSTVHDDHMNGLKLSFSPKESDSFRHIFLEGGKEGRIGR